jgi:recombinational DNA repair protein (RecF pathway)
MKAETIRTQRIKRYPLIIQCSQCGEDKRRTQYYFKANGAIRSHKCIVCHSKPVIELRIRPQIVLPRFDNKHSAMNQIENINHNPKFFSWLCAGTNQKFVQ